jgi:hypothetical protein
MYFCNYIKTFHNTKNMASELFWNAVSLTIFLCDIMDKILFQASWEFKATIYIFLTFKIINCFAINRILKP